MIADEHGYEGWFEFPKERLPLYNLVKNTKTQGVVFTSGDQHWAELTKAEAVLGYPAHDLTASSLDRSFPLPNNSKRVGAATPDANFGVIAVDWGTADPQVQFQICAAANGSFILNHKINLSSLYPWTGIPTGISEPRRRSGSTPPQVRRGRLENHSLTGRRLPRPTDGRSKP